MCSHPQFLALRLLVFARLSSPNPPPVGRNFSRSAGLHTRLPRLSRDREVCWGFALCSAERLLLFPPFRPQAHISPSFGSPLTMKTREAFWSAVAAATAFRLQFMRPMGRGGRKKAVAASTAFRLQFMRPMGRGEEESGGCFYRFPPSVHAANGQGGRKKAVAAATALQGAFGTGQLAEKAQRKQSSCSLGSILICERAPKGRPSKAQANGLGLTDRFPCSLGSFLTCEKAPKGRPSKAQANGLGLTDRFPCSLGSFLICERAPKGQPSKAQANGLGLTDRFPAQALKGRFKEPTVTFYSLR